MNWTKITWKQVWASLKTNTKMFVKSLASILLILLIVVGLVIIKVAQKIWYWMQELFKVVCLGIDKNPRRSVLVVVIVLLFVILVQWFCGRVDMARAQVRIDNLELKNDTIRTNSLYDTGYSQGYVDASRYYAVEYK